MANSVTSSSTGSSGSSAPTLPPEDDLANAVKSLMRLREELAKLAVAAKERKKQVKVLSNTILRLMQQKELRVLQLAQGRNGYLVDEELTKPKTLSKKRLQTMLRDYFKDDPTKAEEVAKYLIENRELSTKRVLNFKKPSIVPPTFDNDIDAIPPSP